VETIPRSRQERQRGASRFGVFCAFHCVAIASISSAPKTSLIARYINAEQSAMPIGAGSSLRYLVLTEFHLEVR